jgi:hypothetical protein
MPVSEPPPPFVMRTVAGVGFDPFFEDNAIALLSSVMTGPAGAVIVNDADVTLVSPGLANVSVRSPAVPEMLSAVNVATPPTEGTVLVPPSVPPPVAIDAETDAVDPVTTFPAASRTSTTGCVASGVPTGAPPGCVRIASWVAVPGFTVT